MHPRTEFETLGAPARIRRLLANEAQWKELLLVAYALDDQPNGAGEYDGEYPDYDKVHKKVETVCRGLLLIEDDLKRFQGILVQLRDIQPQPGVRIRQIESCMACGNDCLPRPIKGFCTECHVKWLTFRHTKQGDRNDFIRITKQEIIEQLAAEQAEDDK